MLYKILYNLARILFSVVYRFEYFGKDNIKDEPYLICGNHSHNLDPIFLVFAFGSSKKMSFMAKKELFKNTLFVWLAKAVNIFPVDRGNADLSAIKNSIRMLKGGYSLMMFPEGTRVKEGEQLNAKAGVGMIAVKSGVKILPMYIGGSKKLFTKVKVIIGEPIDIAHSFSDKKPNMNDYENISQNILKEIYKLKDERGH